MRLSNKKIGVILFFTISTFLISYEVLLRFQLISPETDSFDYFFTIQNYLINDDEPFEAIPFQGHKNKTELNFADSNYYINPQGFRNKTSTSLTPAAGVCRILFLGGPSVFGLCNHPDSSFPVITERILKHKIDSTGLTLNVECINAGLRGATSAEMLIQFLLKYKYFKPSYLVIHAGFNDAYTSLGVLNNVPYNADYSNLKRIFKNDFEFPDQFRFLFSSYVFTNMYIKFFLNDFVYSTPQFNPFYRYTNSFAWQEILENDTVKVLKRENNAFFNNLSALCIVAKNVGIKIVLVPEFTRMNDHFIPSKHWYFLNKSLDSNKRFMHHIAMQTESYYLELRRDQFKTEHFITGDDRYLTYKGDSLKAHFISQLLFDAIQID